MRAHVAIDDGPTDDTPALLELFARRNVRATFFAKGELALARPELVRDILSGGHSVGNHSHTHPSGSFWCLPQGRIAREIDRCNEALQTVTGTQPRWFRAPVGFKNFFVHPLLARRRMRLIGWTARGFDGVGSDVEKVLARVLPDVEPGAIVLHQGRPFSMRVLERLIDEVQQRGYTFVVPDDGRLKTNK